MPQTSEACSEIPPVKVDYTPAGTFVELGGYKQVYSAGSEDSKTVIIG
jgi:hypothetical protein